MSAASINVTGTIKEATAVALSLSVLCALGRAGSNILDIPLFWRYLENVRKQLSKGFRFSATCIRVLCGQPNRFAAARAHHLEMEAHRAAVASWEESDSKGGKPKAPTEKAVGPQHVIECPWRALDRAGSNILAIPLFWRYLENVRKQLYKLFGFRFSLNLLVGLCLVHDGGYVGQFDCSPGYEIPPTHLASGGSLGYVRNCGNSHSTLIPLSDRPSLPTKERGIPNQTSHQQLSKMWACLQHRMFVTSHGRPQIHR